MKEFIEKLIGRLEEKKKHNDKIHKDITNLGIIQAIEIVNQLAEEYKDKEYCWQECASTEHCKECSRLGNGDIDYFESIDDWAESLPTIDAGELLGNGWIPYATDCKMPNKASRVWLSFTTPIASFVKSAWYINGHFEWDNCRRVKEIPMAWKPYDVPAPYQPKGE